MCDCRTVADRAAFLLFLFLFYQRLHMMLMYQEAIYVDGGYVQKVTLFAKMLNCEVDCDDSKVVLQITRKKAN